MVSKWKIASGLLVLALVCTTWRTSIAAEKQTADELLFAAFVAERAGGQSQKIAEKFEAVLKTDPGNYYALIKLGCLKLGNGQGDTRTKQNLTDAADYFLRASIARPNNPEAFLYLAELYYKWGYVPEGDHYVTMASNLQRQAIYDAVCMVGNRYEETGNYYAAIITYAPLVLRADSKFRFDPYLMQRLQNDIIKASPPYDWVYTVFNELLGEERSKESVKGLRAVFSQLLAGYPQMARRDFVELLVKLSLRELVLQIVTNFQSSMLAGVTIPEKHEMPTVLYKLFFCDSKEIPPAPFTDPYEAFVSASFDPIDEQARVLSELRGLQKEALNLVAKENNDLEKAKKLFAWLKKKSLVNYNVLEGYSAKDVVEQQKFLCLSGAILYTLLARDAKLDVNGVVEPGHAYASLNYEGKKRIETTTEGSEGFDYRPESGAKSRAMDRILDLGPYATYGEVTDPMKFVAYQYSNTAAFSIYDLVLNKYEPLLRQVLKSTLRMEDALQADIVSRWKTYGVLGAQEERIFVKLVRDMAAQDDTFRMALIKQLDKNIDFLKTARGLSPFDLKFRDQIRQYIVLAAKYESLPAEVAAEDRRRKRIALEMKKREGQRSLMVASMPGYKNAEGAPDTAAEDTARFEAEMQQLEQEEKQNWDLEKRFWLKAVQRLSAASRSFPCDDTLQTYLGRMYGRVETLAKAQGDGMTRDELRGYAANIQP
jgi:hypothetical protein